MRSESGVIAQEVVGDLEIAREHQSSARYVLPQLVASYHIVGRVHVVDAVPRIVNPVVSEDSAVGVGNIDTIPGMLHVIVLDDRSIGVPEVQAVTHQRLHARRSVVHVAMVPIVG